jgi:hypothetical protein
MAFIARLLLEFLGDWLKAWLFRRVEQDTARTAKSLNGSLLLAYGRVLKILIWLSAVLPALGLACILLFVDSARVPSVWALAVVFGGVGAVALNESRARILICERGLVAFSPWRGTICLTWDEVRSIEYSNLAQWLIIYGRAGEVIRVSDWMVGVGSLIGCFERHLQRSDWRKASALYRERVSTR